MCFFFLKKNACLLQYISLRRIKANPKQKPKVFKATIKTYDQENKPSRVCPSTPLKVEVDTVSDYGHSSRALGSSGT